MTDSKIYQTNDGPALITPVEAELDSVLLYQAQLNVKDRKNLIKHVAAYIITWPLLGILYAVVLDNMRHHTWPRVNTIIRNLEDARGWTSAPGTRSINEAVSFLNWYFNQGHIPAIWYMIIGIMMAWGGWILLRIARRAAGPIAKRFRAMGIRKEKPDPVMQEYLRLKDMAASK